MLHFLMGETCQFAVFSFSHSHLKQGWCLKLQTIVKYLNLLCGELQPWYHKIFQSATFAFLFHFPKFQNRALVVGSGLTQRVLKSLNRAIFVAPAKLLQLLLKCSENVNSLLQFTVKS